MNMLEMVGKRLIVIVKSKKGSVDLGFGTYIWDDEILLDNAKKILGKNCQWGVVESAPEVPPFEVLLTESIRYFNCEGRALLKTSGYVAIGIRITIGEVSVRAWNHGNYLAGHCTKIGWEPWDRWVLISELDLPEERPPYLRVVA